MFTGNDNIDAAMCHCFSKFFKFFIFSLFTEDFDYPMSFFFIFSSFSNVD